MDRRTFNKMMTTAVWGMGVGLEGTFPAQQSGSQEGTPKNWPDRVYRRLLVDTHVPDWNPILLSRFDPPSYVATIARAGFQCLMQYAISCAGLCLWRTKIGQMHRNMKDRDYFGEVMDECKRHGLYRVAYFHVIWDNWGYEHRPDWRYRPAGRGGPVTVGSLGSIITLTPGRGFLLVLVRGLVAHYQFE